MTGTLSPRKTDLVRFGLLGAATFVLLFFLKLRWLVVAAWLLGRERISFDQQPGWIRSLESVVSAVPWVICAALLVLALMRRRWTPLFAFAGAQLLCVGVVIGLLFGAPTAQDYSSRTRFDSASWKAENRPGAKGIRVHMVDDLLRSRKLVGMSREQLENLLGVPPPTAYFHEYDYVYWLGPERGYLSIDSEWLVIRCKSGVVVSAKDVTD